MLLWTGIALGIGVVAFAAIWFVVPFVRSEISAIGVDELERRPLVEVSPGVWVRQ